MNPNTPIIVGIGQQAQKGVDLDKALEPIELMIRAAEAAADEEAAGSLDDLGDELKIRVIQKSCPILIPFGWSGDGGATNNLRVLLPTSWVRLELN